MIALQIKLEISASRSKLFLFCLFPWCALTMQKFDAAFNSHDIARDTDAGLAVRAFAVHVVLSCVIVLRYSISQMCWVALGWVKA